MYEDAEAQLGRILDLVATCPEKLQDKCFEILLNAYVLRIATPPGAQSPGSNSVPPASSPPEKNNPAAIPELIRPKLTTMAARNKIPIEKAVILFDFNTDPFTYHAFVAPGTGNSEKMRNVALALALKNYLTTGSWSTDWVEFRGACLDQNCFDRANASKNLGNSRYFKTYTKAEGINLSSQGITAAEALFVSLAGGASE